MPGILGLLSLADVGESRQRFDGALDAMCRGYEGVPMVICSVGHLLLGAAVSPSYPIRTRHAERHMIVVEGHIYNTSATDVEEELVSRGEDLFLDADTRQAAVSRWVRQWDGDFIVVMFSRERNELVVFSDALGRLPVYYHCGKRQFVFGRRAVGVSRLGMLTSIDEVGFGQVLWQGHPYGGRTLVRDVRAGPPSLLVHCAVGPGEVTARVESVSQLRFDRRKVSDRPVGHEAMDVADIVTECCRDVHTRCRAPVNIVSLSGGMDSRAVAAGMVRAGCECVASSMYYDVGRCEDDVRIAEEVAQSLGMKWELHPLPEPDQTDLERLIQIKDGLNFAGVAFVLKFLDVLRDRWGSKALYLTGDGGGCLKEFPYCEFKPTCSDVRRVCEIIATQHGMSDAGTVEEFLGLRRGILFDELAVTVGSFPEEDNRGRLEHFEVFERERRWLYEGEDRNRHFFWSAAPLTSMRLVSHCATLADSVRRNNRLYRAVQMYLSHKAARVPEAYAELAPSSRFYCAKLAAIRLGRRGKSWLRQKGLIGKRPATPDEVPEPVRSALTRESQKATSDRQAKQRLESFLVKASALQLAYLVTVTGFKHLWAEECSRSSRPTRS